MHCLPFFQRIKFSSGCFRQVFFLWGTKKVVAGHIRQMVILYSNDYRGIWADSALVVFDEWSSNRGGYLGRF